LTSTESTLPQEDGLIAPEAGAWTEDKHRLVSLYATLFSSAMKYKWDERVYIELYAGAGYAKNRKTSKLIFGSPLNALRVKHLFDRYVFCEGDPEKLRALKARVKASHHLRT
jgi:three-Cys-motif partner protein